MAKNEDEKAIRDMIKAWSEAIRAGDAVRAVEFMAPKVTSYELRPPLQYRDAAARSTKDLQEWLASWDGPLEIEMRDPTIAVDGDLAFAYGLSRMRGKKRVGGPVELWYRTTLCFHRQRGQWKLVHEHASVPFLMDGSEKAALHLHP
jgi:ketosteroid isomerase-like protein